MQSKLKLQLITLLLCLLPMGIQAQEVLYSWQSPNGTVEEVGGTLEHINQNGRDKRNVRCGDFYTFVLNGDYMYIDYNYQVDECSYMKITLADGNTFKAGDEIEVTAMRNNQADRPASIYFLFHADQEVPLFDIHVWNNLGEGKDATIGGGTSSGAKACILSHEASLSDETYLSEVASQVSSFAPSTYTFVVPEEADGAKYLRLSRYETGDWLYVSRFVVRRISTSGISHLSQINSPHVASSKKFLKGSRLLIKRGKQLFDAKGCQIK